MVCHSIPGQDDIIRHTRTPHPLDTPLSCGIADYVMAPLFPFQSASTFLTFKPSGHNTHTHTHTTSCRYSPRPQAPFFFFFAAMASLGSRWEGANSETQSSHPVEIDDGKRISSTNACMHVSRNGRYRVPLCQSHTIGTCNGTRTTTSNLRTHSTLCIPQ